MLSLRWLHPNISGKDAERLLLEHGVEGSFLVRRSLSETGNFCLSFRQRGTVIHIKIQNAGEYYDLYGGEKFATLADLVMYYADGQEKLKETNGNIIELKVPFLCEDVPVERWFHGPICGSEAEKLLLKRGEKGHFLVRESRSRPGNYVVSVCTDKKKVKHVKVEVSSPNDGQKQQYNVEGDRQRTFASLIELVDFYRSNPASTDGTHSDLFFAKPLYTTSGPAKFIRKRMNLLEQNVSSGKGGYLDEFNQLQQLDVVERDKNSRNEGAKDVNRTKNRYKNILPFDKTRVVLHDGDPKVDGSDYINANYIQDEGVPVQLRKARFIASQGCRKETLADFWRMVWQEQCAVIVMITREVERGKLKCVRYWPSDEDPDKTMSFAVYGGRITVMLLDDRSFAEDPNAPNGVDNAVFHVRDIQVTREDNAGNREVRKVTQFQLQAWADHGLPPSEACLLDFMTMVNERYVEQASVHPIVVHCSAGIGRTGVFAIISMVISRIKQYGVEVEVDIMEMIRMIRMQRSGMVQTDQQYKFIYSTIACYVDNFVQPSNKQRSTMPASTDDVYFNLSLSSRPSIDIYSRPMSM